jgi:peptidoglycan/LPS O-acetylase OafA/YrhL
LGNLDLPRMILATPLYAPGWWWAFAPGMALALVERDHPEWLRPRRLFGAGVALLSIELIALYELPASAGEFERSGLLVLGAVALMASSLHWQPRRGALLAALAADVSYPFYLWHASILSILSPLGSGYLLLVAGFSLTVAASSASVLLFERPFRQLWSKRQPRLSPRSEGLSRSRRFFSGRAAATSRAR